MIFALVILAGGTAVLANAQTPFKSNPACELFLTKLSLSLVDRRIGWSYPSALLHKKFPNDPYPSVLASFEDDVIALYTETAPEIRDWQAFANRWELTLFEVEDIRAFYGLNFFDHPDFANRAELIGIARARALAHFIASREHPAARHFEYFKANVGRLSVPEMAVALRMPEADVYRELSLLGISVRAAFDDRSIRANTQAARFARHFARIESRAVPWMPWEDQLLVERLDEGRNYFEIANELNGAGNLNIGSTSPRRRNPEHPQLRTELSVAGRVLTMGLTRLERRGQLDISIEPYGIVKRAGSLVSLPAIEYLLDHRSEPRATVANALGVSLSALEQFIRRQKLAFLIEEPNVPISRAYLSENGAENFARNVRDNDAAMVNLIAAIAKTGKFPSEASFRNAVGVSSRRFFGENAYRAGQRHEAYALNVSRREALTNVRNRLTSVADLTVGERTVVEDVLNREVSNCDLKAYDRAALNDFALSNLIQWIARLGQFPGSLASTANAREFKAIVGVGYQQLFGLADYGPGERLASTSLNLSRVATFERALQVLPRVEIAAELRENVAVILAGQLATAKFDALSVPEQRVVAMDRLIAGVARIRRFPETRSKGQANPLQTILGFEYSKFVGTGPYRPTGHAAQVALYPSRLAAIEATLARLSKTVAIAAEQKPLVRSVLADEISLLKEDNLPLAKQNERAMDKLIDLIATSGKMPTFGKKSATKGFPLGVNDERFFGIGNYRPTASRAQFALNLSRADALRATLARLKMRGDVDATVAAKVFAVLTAAIAVAESRSG